MIPVDCSNDYSSNVLHVACNVCMSLEPCDRSTSKHPCIIQTYPAYLLLGFGILDDLRGVSNCIYLRIDLSLSNGKDIFSICFLKLLYKSLRIKIASVMLSAMGRELCVGTFALWSLGELIKEFEAYHSISWNSSSFNLVIGQEVCSCYMGRIVPPIKKFTQQRKLSYIFPLMIGGKSVSKEECNINKWYWNG